MYSVQKTKTRLTCENCIANYKIVEEHQLISSSCSHADIHSVSSGG